jgi:uncharacterized protein (TIGR02466 family)
MLYRQFIHQNPNHPTALQLHGQLLAQRGEFEPAIERMVESLAVYPDQAEVANNLGSAQVKLGRLEQAAESFRMALQIYPPFTEARRNLGLCRMRQNKFDEALQCFRIALDHEPDDPMTLQCLGDVCKANGQIGEAIAWYEKALDLNPDAAEVHHNLAVCFRIKQQSTEALQHLSRARDLGLERAELYHNLGNTLIDKLDPDGAIAAYKLAIEKNPLDIDSHRNLNSLLWQCGLTEEHLRSYQIAIEREPNAVALRIAYATSLNQIGLFDTSERVLLDALDVAPKSSQLKSLLAYALEGQGQWGQAVDAHLDAVNSPDSVPEHRVGLARALLACGSAELALGHAEIGALQLPFDQRALAYLGLCWRILGDERDDILNNYDDFVASFDLPIPVGYSSIEEFNEHLAQSLQPLHHSKQYPPGQSMRGGTQTAGNLFDHSEKVFGDLVGSLRQCIKEYIANMSSDNEHPFLVRRNERFEFSASWSVQLSEGGFHQMHVHPLGWVSSAYYVRIPSSITKPGSSGGELILGQPDIDIGEPARPRRVIKPKAGTLVLFPSYMWHGTAPFSSPDFRTIVSFDVVPRRP